MPAQTFVDRVRARGVKVVEMPNWKTTNRNSVGPWNDVYGIVEHHTGSDTVDPYGYAGFLQRGSTALIGPLSQFSTAPDGTLYMIGWGRCNHAGGGDPNVLAAVKADAVPLNRELKPAFGNSNGVDGNRAFYGNEIMFSGGHPMTSAQLRTSLLTDVVICEWHGWTGASVIGHREWSRDKPDPGYQDMAAKRRMVDEALKPSIPPPLPPPVIERGAPEMRIIRSRETGACYEVGPVLCQHIPTIERLRALEKTWGPLIEMSQAEVQYVWDQTVSDILATRENFPVPTLPKDPPTSA
jgi:hypothetical protein